MTTITDLEATTTINATPAQVWAAITDLPRMSSWSPQVVKTVVFGQVKEGTRFLNINHQGWKHWPTNAKVVRFAPHSDFAFRITENTTVWSYQLAETAEGTAVTHRRETPTGISALSRSLTKVAFGGQENFTEELRTGMATTLAKLKADLEG
ncbi:SRPBCC family protein [Nocardioides sp. NPDC057577]|uniref:SRPBCC family protein n=1 Tax=Nocardioides sp. NPDC057577 TaxID=3346171 RepID=UPI00366B0750